MTETGNIFEFQRKTAKIKVVGVGGGGGNAVNRMVEAKISAVDFVALNTDSQDLRRNLAPYRVQMGENLTKGLGVGGDPEKGRKAAEESAEQIRQVVRGVDLLFVTAGMGGGTGTGAAPVVAKVAREECGEDILIIGVVTRPFQFEGNTRAQQAESGIREIRKYVDSLLVIPNERLFSIIDKHTSDSDAYRMADEVLRQAIQGITDIITRAGQVNVDFNDVKRVMANSGPALIGIGEKSGEGKHLAAAREAVKSPLLENAELDGARGLIVHFLSRKGDLTLMEQREAVDFIRETASKDVVLIYGTAYDESVQEDSLRITVIATGFSNDLTTRKVSARKVLRQASPERGGALPGGPGAQKEEPVRDEMLVPAFLRRGKKKGFF
ncbi:MAG: cell division protein FtsZ [Elusimicrobiaceae bacterium]|nr:cell division protein FtsZ [Elusimicrobiaceae bacterium]